MIAGIDRQIIDALARDGRTPFTELARSLGVAEATIRSRAKRLRASGLLRIVALLDEVRMLPGVSDVQTLLLLKMYKDYLAGAARRRRRSCPDPHRVRGRSHAAGRDQSV